MFSGSSAMPKTLLAAPLTSKEIRPLAQISRGRDHIRRILARADEVLE
jgi:hypothetical protein